ncbi:hypothetical protein MYO4S_00019 [Serratia phage 4S]|nr:hypothetical protein MYO4S_00019 [Serratia phage 4S]
MKKFYYYVGQKLHIKDPNSSITNGAIYKALKNNFKDFDGTVIVDTVGNENLRIKDRNSGTWPNVYSVRCPNSGLVLNARDVQGTSIDVLFNLSDQVSNDSWVNESGKTEVGQQESISDIKETISKITKKAEELDTLNQKREAIKTEIMWLSEKLKGSM